MTGANTPVQGKRKTKVGRVVSDKMDKTIVVSVERLARHRLYKRVMEASTKLAAHDDGDQNSRLKDQAVIGLPNPMANFRLQYFVAGEHFDIFGQRST